MMAPGEGESDCARSSAPANGSNVLNSSKSLEIKDLVPPNSTSLWDALVVLLYHMLPFTLAPLSISILFVWWGTKVVGWLFPAAYFTLCAILVALPPLYSSSLRTRLRFLYFPLARYMTSVRYAAPTTPIPEGSYIFAIHPHGRMFYSATMLVQTDNIWRKPFLPSGEIFMAAAGGFFWVPFLGNILTALGAMPASRGNIIRKLRQKQHVAIVPGGVKEVCVGTCQESDTLYLLKRKGFLRIAMEERVGVIPIYSFNENQIFKHDPKWLLKFWEGVNKRANVGVPFMRGIWNLPMPFRKDLLCVVGEPLFPRREESLDEFHARYILTVRKLFDDYVKLSPRPKHKLIII